MEFKEKLPTKEQKYKIRNFLELRDFLQEKFGNYLGLFETTLRAISGIKDLSELPRDKEERKRVIEEALRNTPLTPENIKSINEAMQGVTKINKAEIEHFRQRPGKERYVEDCQKVVDALGYKNLILDENGNIALIENSGK